MPTTIINASAGSGKTYRLAVAYLQALLLPGRDGVPVSPHQVLATTFTRAAASEILERVLRRLALAVVSDTDRKQLLNEIKRPELGRDDLAALLTGICQAMPQLQISTIDALFARIVRVLGLDLGFPTAWTIADDTLQDELALEAADRMLHGLDPHLALGPWRRYSQFKPGFRVRSALVDLLEETRFLLIDAAIAADDPALAEPACLAAQEAIRITCALDVFPIPRTKGKTPEPHKSWVKAIDQIKAAVRGEPTLVSILEGPGLLRIVEDPEGKYYSVPVPADLREILAPLLAQARTDLRRLHDARLPALTALARHYHGIRLATAYAAAAYRFAEVEDAVRMLPPHLSPDDLYFRLDGRIQHLLLDEFQDTSLSQFRFLWPLIEEVRANGHLFFAVGDVKQSIYGWRGADRRLLDRLPDWLDPQHQDQTLTRESLNENRRSSPAVLKAIDRIFEHLDRFRCLDPASYREKNHLERATVFRAAAASFISGYRAHVAAGENRHLVGRVRLQVTGFADTDNESEDAATPGELETIMATVEEHLREDPEREVAILLRRRKWIPFLIAGLRRRGIVASGEGGNPVADSAAVEMVLSMLTWTDHPGHSLARGHVELGGLAAVFGFTGTSRDRYVPKSTLTAIMKSGLADVVAGWVRDDHFRRRCTVHDHVRCEQLVELAAQWDATGGGRLSRFVARVRSQRRENPISSHVRVMTIHGCKGLEFEAVILGDLQSKERGGDGPHFVVTTTTPDNPPGIELLPRRNDAGWLGLEELHSRHRQSQFEEDLSVLYVALTRARSFLDVVIPATEKISPSLITILGEGWGGVGIGTHLVEEYKPDVRPARTVKPDVIGPEASVWKAGDELSIPHLVPTPERLTVSTPSGQEGAGVVKLGQILNTTNRDALERGTAVHALLSHLEWIDSLTSPSEWADSIPEREANPETCRLAAQDLHARLSDPLDPLAQVFAMQRWLQRWKDAGVLRLEVWRERRFAVVLDRELVNGSFDRVVLGFDANRKSVRAVILDFKTDRIAGESERIERRQFYQPQLDAYARALHQLTGLPSSAIQTQIVWVNPTSAAC